MKTKEEIKRWLLENCVDRYGNLDLSSLDFSDFEGNIFIGYMKVKNNLYQYYQMVGGSLFQSCQVVDGDLLQYGQKVQGNLNQSYQTAGRDLFQYSQSVGVNLFSQKLKEDEVWEDKDYCMMRVKKLKEITADELAKMGYKLKGEE